MPELTVGEKKLLVDGLGRLQAHCRQIARNDISDSGYYDREEENIKTLVKKIAQRGLRWTE